MASVKTQQWKRSGPHSAVLAEEKAEELSSASKEQPWFSPERYHAFPRARGKEQKCLVTASLYHRVYNNVKKNTRHADRQKKLKKLFKEAI